MKALIDLHTHTLVSGHAYSTIKENVEAANLAGLKYIGLSEHAPKGLFAGVSLMLIISKMFMLYLKKLTE